MFIATAYALHLRSREARGIAPAAPSAEALGFGGKVAVTPLVPEVDAVPDPSTVVPEGTQSQEAADAAAQQEWAERTRSASELMGFGSAVFIPRKP